MKIKGVFLCILLFVILVSTVYAEIELKAEVDKKSVSTDDEIIYKLSVSASGEKQLPLPKFPGFKGFLVISQANTSNISIKGRESILKAIYVFILLPQEIGKLTIDAAEIKASGKVYKSDSFESVHLCVWPKSNPLWKNEEVNSGLESILKLRPYVLKALEDCRSRQEIGSSLDAQIILLTSEAKRYTFLTSHRQVLASIFIVSQVNIEKVEIISSPVSEEFKDISIKVEKALGSKCSRCWNYSDFVGKDADHPLICQRCLKVVHPVRNVD